MTWDGATTQGGEARRGGGVDVMALARTAYAGDSFLGDGPTLGLDNRLLLGC
jgi:hypothetical protein